MSEQETNKGMTLINGINTGGERALSSLFTVHLLVQTPVSFSCTILRNMGLIPCPSSGVKSQPNPAACFPSANRVLFEVRVIFLVWGAGCSPKHTGSIASDRACTHVFTLYWFPNSPTKNGEHKVMDLFFFPYTFSVGVSLGTGLLTAQVYMVATQKCCSSPWWCIPAGNGDQSPSASKLELHIYCLPVPGQTVLQPPPSKAFPHSAKRWMLRASM